MRTIGLALTLSAVCLLGPRAALAHSEEAKQCISQSKTTFKTCRTDCNTDYKEARFACRGVDPACGIPCLATKRECGETAKEPLTTCVTACEQTLQAEKAACRQDVIKCPPDTPDVPSCDECIDAAQVKGFTCRDQCREDFRRNQTAQDALRKCQDDFKTCVQACPEPAAD